jgi:hypothetical protein
VNHVVSERPLDNPGNEWSVARGDADVVLAHRWQQRLDQRTYAGQIRHRSASALIESVSKQKQVHVNEAE